MDEQGIDINQIMEEKREELRLRYPESYCVFESYYNHMFEPSFVFKEPDEIMEIINIIREYEKFSLMKRYDEKSGDIYNVDKIFKLYSQKIFKDKNEFIKDLIYLYRFGWINIYIPSGTEKDLLKPIFW